MADVRGVSLPDAGNMQCPVCFKNCANGLHYLSEQVTMTGWSMSLSELLLKCAPVQVESTFAQTICTECYDRAIKSYTFQLLCESTDRFRHQSKKDPAATDIKPEIRTIMSHNERYASQINSNSNNITKSNHNKMTEPLKSTTNSATFDLSQDMTTTNDIQIKMEAPDKESNATEYNKDSLQPKNDVKLVHETKGTIKKPKKSENECVKWYTCVECGTYRVKLKRSLVNHILKKHPEKSHIIKEIT